MKGFIDFSAKSSYCTYIKNQFYHQSSGMLDFKQRNLLYDPKQPENQNANPFW